MEDFDRFRQFIMALETMLWVMAFGLYSLAALVSCWAVGEATSGFGTEGARPIALFGCQPHIKVHQGASNPADGQKNQAIGRTKDGLIANQRRSAV